MSTSFEHSLWLQHSWVNAKAQVGSDHFAVYDPASGERLANVSEADSAVVSAAVDAAFAAWPCWRDSASSLRQQYLAQWADALYQQRQLLAQIICRESGKVYREAEAEILSCRNTLLWYASECRRLQGEHIGSDNNLQRFTCKQSIGVTACITPWNFPAAAVVVKVGAALAAGCTVVLKPSEKTPLIALALAWLAHQAGFPAGSVNVVATSRPAIFAGALADPRVAMLSFTGSTAVGKHLYSQCAATVKRLSLELGGNAPFIVFDDCDINTAVEGLIGARFYNAGQICVGANRVYVQSGIYQHFATALATKVAALKVGAGHRASSDFGPLIDNAAAERLQAAVDDAIAKGAKRLCGGSADPENPRMYAPTVLSDMQDNMEACHREVFGPVACLYRFENEAEVLARANASPAGLAAYVYTAQQSRLFRMSKQLEAGTIGANATHVFADELPFGGVKQSGLGREHGSQCLEPFLETKSITMGIQTE
ncbi:MAG: aldehyde dehydrogenase family protein [Cellvibrionaceae bacterium]|nr:aldehyde dehydrogenase family protein [Cellvibrionaceae bacterium]